MQLIHGIVGGLLCLLIVLSGCTQSSENPGGQPLQTPETFPSASPTTVPIPNPAKVTSLSTTTIPTPAYPESKLPTIIRDSGLLFTVSAPEGFMGRTVRVAKDLGYNTMYKTTIFSNTTPDADAISYENSGNYYPPGDGLTIFTYTITLNQDQDIKNYLRDNAKNLTESQVTSKGIQYDRFEMNNNPFAVNSTAKNAEKTVVFVGSKKTSNEKGLAVEIIYGVSDSSTIGMAGHEKMVQSFAWIPRRNIEGVSGTETDKPPFYQ